MSPTARALAACLVATLGAAALLGCDTLFPEFAGKPRDAGLADGAAGDGGAVLPHLAGAVCILGAVDDYRSCAPGAPGILRITVEETRQQTMTDVAGHFTLPLAEKLTVATVAVVDPRGAFATSVLPLRLADGAADQLALPVIDAQALADAALQNGAALDPSRGSVLAWATDPAGTPVAGATVDAPTAIRAGSALLLFDVAPTTLMLTLTPPAATGLAADQFTLPIRAGAVTMSTLPLPPRQ